ncbi:MAG: T9SS type A sorting domain-containing protein [Bacteroidetes bacterium]|mgnify:CR=1 FL=1|nr:T9SS type A sorting domain-containing protein [Bacteroidota bacterium]MBK9524416.1 T9SS type A sorting domain-containing protein [Bacteroidota bacterium]MBK9543514.1 T9SS type A sorting domain-containing protein [Bacteroidota bacterium]MBP6402459.1 T9SS type A sorting domain-containing protein [Bacteroidia bacterium]MBP6648401.1 T9SS type A sorting domain-containing protein [Bacteroidia bacterium]
MKLIVFLISLNALYFDCIGQSKNAIWCFGDSAGVDFNNTANPIPFISGMNAKGTCASISDISGNLKFYCASPDIENFWNGVSQLGIVYNREHQKMYNSDSLICRSWYHEMSIVPHPTDTNIYFIFHIGVTTLFGLYYSVIDVRQDSGRGAVISKNNQLRSEAACDCIQAVKHGNGRDWWIIFKDAQIPNNQFYVYSITSSGVSFDHIDSVGLSSSSNGGDLGFSSTGEKFSFCNYKGLLAIYNFNRCTGTITLNQTIRAEDPNGNYPYFFDCCFSPNDSLLYLSCAPYLSDFDTTHIFLYQLPVTSANPYASKTLIWNRTAPHFILGVRLAPDNKIYVASGSGGYPYDSSNYSVENMNLSVINEPNQRGSGLTCDFQPYSFYLGGKRTYWGLPNNPDYDLGPLTGSSCDSLSVEITELDVYSEFTFYPNPANDELTIHFIDSNSEKIKITLLDLKGTILLQKTTLREDQKLDISRIVNGVYLLKTETEFSVCTHRFVKMN